MTDTHLSELSFDSLELAPSLMQGITEAGFSRCTPIQAQTLPVALRGRDVAGQAQTGTGKTAAFLVALFQTLLKQPPAENHAPTAIRALVIAPTRELAAQIHKDAIVLGKHTGLRGRRLWSKGASCRAMRHVDGAPCHTNAAIAGKANLIRMRTGVPPSARRLSIPSHGKCAYTAHIVAPTFASQQQCDT